MSSTTTQTAEAAEGGLGRPVTGRLSFLDRWLPVWILAAMGVGLGAGRLVPGLGGALDAVTVDGVSVPIGVGLLAMMYPVLAKVRYDRLEAVTRDRRLLIPSLALNWIIGPAVMFALAWLMLPDLPAYRTGLIIVGLARCIAMVIIWNDLACGDREAAAVLVALNSIFQILAFAGLGWFYLQVLPGWLGLSQTGLHASPGAIAGNVGIFLGIPLLAGYTTRRLGEKTKGRTWYEQRFLPRIGPLALYGLLFTIVVLFALQGHQVTTHPLDVARIAAPLLAYFALMWCGSFALGRAVGLGYPRTATLAFTAAGNNFELAIAVAIATYGPTSGQALAGVVGPLIEVPVLIGLVHLSLTARRRFTTIPSPTHSPTRPASEEPPMSHRPEVLFVCVHNAGRSQMAAALLHHHAAGAVTVRSAGSQPAATINPAVTEAMAEIGLDLTRAFPKPLTEDALHTADVVIIMGCGDTCPIHPGKRYLTWDLPDPAGKPLADIRLIRDEIDQRVQALLTELLTTST